VSDAIFDVLEPLLGAEHLELIDLEVRSSLVKVTVDRPGGVDLESLALANRVASDALDELDPIPGRYTLEVSSPGVERRLRTPAHFEKAVGETVSIRTRPGTSGTRRIEGRLESADGEGVDVVADEGTTHLTYGEIERARTVFSWGGAPKPGGSKRTKKSAESGQGKKQHKSRSSAGARSGAEGSKDATERVTTS
jgi:ribosome maturation factor RimP